MSDAIQSLCELGQSALLATEYLDAEQHLVAAEGLAWEAKDYDALARLYMPLQETRRQRRLLCGEGFFGTFLSLSVEDTVDVAELAKQHSRGQLIVAGFGSITPAAELRVLASEHKLYLDLPLAAAYDVAGQTVIVIVPTPDVALPLPAEVDSIDTLLRRAPAHCVLIPATALPPDQARGDSATFGYMMSLWETLHAPFLAMADASTDPKLKLMGYRETIRVDYAAEFAHQRFSDTARLLSRTK